MKLKLLTICVLTSLSSAFGSTIVPKPVSEAPASGKFRLSGSSEIIYNNEQLAPLAGYLKEYLDPAVGATLTTELRDEQPIKAKSGQILLLLDPSLDTPAEGYNLKVSRQAVTLTGKDYGGVFNGIETLLQLMPTEIYAKKFIASKINVGCTVINDYPRFSYRGMMLDVARTFVPAEGVKAYIDKLAHHKINKFHWHLTDDEGWRIQLKSHPEMAEIGGFRGGDSPVKSIYGEWDKKYGGYYTQDEIRDVVAYAAVRNIEVIPEIELPGHSRTAARVHPEILCDYTPDLTATGGYDRRSAWCASKESNYELLDEIISEVCTLFPSKYFHVGGDEVVMEQWLTCPHCRAMMEEMGTDDPHRIEDYFMSRIEQILKKNGKIPAVWNEAINGGQLSKTTRVHGWKDVAACLKATSEGFSTIVMPGAYFYFDMRQSPIEAGHNWAGIFDVSKCYSFDFEKEGFTEENMKNVAGVQAAFWSEAHISNGAYSTDFVEYQTFPRLCALAEIGWTPQELRSYDDFNSRIRGQHQDRMAAMNIHFRMFPPTVEYKDGIITATAPSEGAEIRYTSDGKDIPTVDSPLYTGPIEADTAAALRYQFRAFYRTGVSATVPATPLADSLIKPSFRLMTSFEELEKSPYSIVEEYKTFCRTGRTPMSGDWVMYLFDEPVDCRSMQLITGFWELPAYQFITGYVEVSYDGHSFERVCDLDKGRITIYPDEGKLIYGVRVVCTTDTNGYANIFIHYPRIKPRK